MHFLVIVVVKMQNIKARKMQIFVLLSIDAITDGGNFDTEMCTV